MTDKHTHDTLAPDALDVLAAVAPLAPVAWASKIWMDNMARMTGEIATFVTARIKEDVQTRQALMQCKTLSEVQHVQAAFMQKAVAQYQAETGKLIEMTTKLAADLNVKPVSHAQ
ncbi:MULTISPECIES: phasin family protein [unclassified Yoonia]|uniref:phasin family protein n=1 Tax=unclassified Yoonia TaxID=2629118 RepID=UPI002AFEDAEF|nr:MULTISPECIES: phasin family protein [unclassified Yoonia]